MIRRRLPAGRRVICSHCAHPTVRGMTRVMRHVVFHFCPGCWANRDSCEEQMREVTSVS